MTSSRHIETVQPLRSMHKGYGLVPHSPLCLLAVLLSMHHRSAQRMTSSVHLDAPAPQQSMHSMQRGQMVLCQGFTCQLRRSPCTAGGHRA